MAKRILDVVIGGVLFVVALPIILMLAVALAIELQASPFFVQERIGQGGRPIRFLKLRTLPPTTPAYALKHDLDDMSLSRLRAFLRDRHLDELPQLWHVLAGDLSLVGPRPRMPDAFEPVDGDYATWRVEVPQGCSGLWQIGRHQDDLPSEHPEYDRFYIEHHSLGLDLWILWRTGLQAVGLAEPVGLADVPNGVLRQAIPVPHLLEMTDPGGPAIHVTLDAPSRREPRNQLTSA